MTSTKSAPQNASVKSSPSSRAKRKLKLAKRIRNLFDEFQFRLKLTILSLGELLKKPRYIAVFLISWYAILYILTFFRDGSGNWSLRVSNLSFSSKIQLLERVGVEVWHNFANLYGLALITLAVLQAIVIISILYAFRHREREQMREGAIDSASTGVIGALIGFMLTAAFTTAKVLMDNTIKNDDDVMKYLHMPVLAAIPYYEE